MTPTHRPSLLKQLSEEGLKLLRLGTNNATYSYENGRTLLCIRGETVSLSNDELEEYSRRRGSFSVNNRTPSNVKQVLEDLIYDSLVPITESDHDTILRRAPHFLSAFDKEALWITAVPKKSSTPSTPSTTSSSWLPLEASDSDDVLSTSSATHKTRSLTPASVYLRQRFPHLRFEWTIDHPAYELREMCVGSDGESGVLGSEFTMKTSWRALACGGTNSVSSDPLVASGLMMDTIKITKDYQPLITQRVCVVEYVPLPASLKPIRLPLVDHDHQQNRATSSMTALLHRSSSSVSALIAFSALLTSLTPLLISLPIPVPPHILELILSSLGSTCAILGLVVMVCGKILKGMEALESAASMGSAELDARVSEKEILEGRMYLGGGEEGFGPRNGSGRCEVVGKRAVSSGSGRGGI